MLKRMGIFTAALALSGLFAGGSWARPVSELEKKELAQLVTAVNNAAERKDASLLVNTMPERLYREMAARMHISEGALRANMGQAVAAQFAQLGAHGYQLDSAAIRYAQTKDGTFYALVPTRIETQTAITEFMTPALFDNTKWHLIYGGQKTLQNPVFTEIYPYTADIVIPAAHSIAKTAAPKK